MKIAHVVPFPPFREGQGTACYYIATALRELGVDVTVFSPAHKLSEYDKELEFYQFLPKLFAIQNAYFTPGLLAIGNWDIIHLHYPFVIGSELLWIKMLGEKTPLILHYHSDLIGVGIGLKSRVFSFYQQFVAPLILNRATKFVFNSLDHAYSTWFSETIFRRRKHDLVDIPVGVAVDKFIPNVDGKALRQTLGFSEDDVVVFFVSSLDQGHVSKGLFDLIEAFSLLVEFDKLKLMVVGEGEMRVEYEQCALNTGLAERIVFVGWVHHEDLPAYYSASDMVVIPAVAESFGLAIAEGMASGKPVIATNNPGVRKVVKDNWNGFLTPHKDIEELARKMKKLAISPHLRQVMGQRGREWVVNNFTWKIAGKRLLDLYQEIM